MHEHISYDNLWLFIIGAIILSGLLLFITPKLMNFLDRWVDGKYQKNEKPNDMKKSKANKQKYL